MLPCSTNAASAARMITAPIHRSRIKLLARDESEVRFFVRLVVECRDDLGDTLEHDDVPLLERSVERCDPRLMRVADQQIAAINASGAAVMRVRRTKLAAIILLVGIVDVRHEAVDVHDDVVEIDAELVAGAEVGFDLLEADDIRDRLTNVRTRGADALRDEMLFGARPKDLSQLRARDGTVGLQADVFEDLPVAAAHPFDRLAIDFG